MYREDVFHNMKYVVKFPTDYVEGKQYPVIIFMHGAGTRGDNLDEIKNGLYFGSTDAFHTELSFISVVPQCYKDTWFDLFETVNLFAEHIAKESFTDSSRLYLMGTSMGGYAVWQMAMSNPALYAAIVPICGGGMYWNASRLVHIPVWAFHGDSDPVVKCRESELLVDSVNANGGNAKLTLYKDCGHDAWSETYKNKEVFEWLLKHAKKSENVIGGNFADSSLYG